MRILLIEPQDNAYVSGRIYPSGALVLLGTMARQKGHDVSIIHVSPDKIAPAEMIKEVYKFKPEIVGITMNTFQTKSAKEISRAIKKISKDIVIVAGGPHPSALKKEIFKRFPEIDIVVYGEGEFSFLEIAEGKNLNKISGICYDNKENPPRPYAQSLEYIPLPNFNIIKNAGKLFLQSKKMYIMASRGCPFHCNFCNKSVWGTNVRFRSPTHIIREIKWLYNKYGIEEIFFQDDLLNLNRKWAEEIFNSLINTGLNKKMTYKIALRANQNLIDEPFLRLAKKAGVYSVFIGVESGNQEMLNRMKKDITIEEIKRAFSLARRTGLETTASFILGLPGETDETIRDSIKLSREIMADDCGFTLLIPFPGTEAEKNLRQKGYLLNQNYDEYFLGNCLIRSDDLSQEQLSHYFKKLNAARNIKMLRNKFTKNYMKIFLKESVKNPRSLLRRVKTVLDLVFVRFEK